MKLAFLLAQNGKGRQRISPAIGVKGARETQTGGLAAVSSGAKSSLGRFQHGHDCWFTINERW